MKRWIKRKFYYSKLRKILVRIYRNRVLNHTFPKLYKKAAKKDVNKKKVVFVEIRHEKLTDNFELIYNYLEKKGGYEISAQYLRMGLTKRLDYTKRCKKMIADIADAGYVFLNDASDVMACLPIRKETVVTQLWHACGAFKKFGMSTADLIFGENRKSLEKHPYYGNLTHVTVSSPEVVWAYEEAMSLKDKPGVVKPVGVSRTDVFFDSAYLDAARQRVEKVCKQVKNKKIVLYAPTFRGRVASAKTLDVLDYDMLQSKLGSDYVFLVKHHPLVKNLPEIPENCKNFAIDVTKTLSIEDLLCVSDICISDYSSLVFEYSLFERPMLFLAPDLDTYFDWRGFYYPYDEFVPGPIVNDTNEVLEFIQEVDESFDATRVKAFREKFMSACDGHATERICKLIFGEE